MRDARSLGDLVREVQVDGAVLDQVQEQVGDVAGVELAGVQRHRRWHVSGADDGHAADIDVLTRLGELDIATRLGGEVDDDRAGTHPLGSPPW